jgi:hypothetical protein
MAEFQDHGSSEALLASIKDQADDIERAVIPRTEKVSIQGNDGKVIVTEAGIVLHLVGGGFRVLHPKDAELILNDGLLNRLRIPIEFMKIK